MIRVGLSSGEVIIYDNGVNATVDNSFYLTIYNKDNNIIGQFKDWTFWKK